MSTGSKKLSRDLEILAAMAAEMEEYLRSDVLFWQMMSGGMPKLTLGGYLMRENRLLVLTSLLSPEEQVKLEAAVTQFNRATVEKVVRLEQKANHELGARIRQWSEFLRDLAEMGRERQAAAYGYRTAVETRTMIAALIDKLSLPPYKLESRLKEKVRLLDDNLRRRWQNGEFLWPASWRPAYPRDEYWWLYGHPQ